MARLRGGEVTTSAEKLIQSLRNRGVESSTIECALESGGTDAPSVPISTPDWGLVVCPFKEHRGEMLMNVPPDYLRWILGWINDDADRITRFGDFAHAVEEFLKQGS